MTGRAQQVAGRGGAQTSVVVKVLVSQASVAASERMGTFASWEVYCVHVEQCQNTTDEHEQYCIHIKEYQNTTDE